MPEHVVPGVSRLALGIANGYLLEADDGLVLVDTGTPGNAGAILGAIAAVGRRPADLREIVLTHQHADHAGSVAAVAAATGARVTVGALDARVVREGLVPVTGTASGTLFGFFSRFIRPMPLEAAPVGREVVDGEVLEGATGLRAIHTPGHTPGHTSYLWPSGGGVLFVGDAAANLFNRLGRPIVASDWPSVARSVARLAELEFETAVFGHGRVIRHRGAARFRKYAEQVARETGVR